MSVIVTYLSITAPYPKGWYQLQKVKGHTHLINQLMCNYHQRQTMGSRLKRTSCPKKKSFRVWSGPTWTTTRFKLDILTKWFWKVSYVILSCVSASFMNCNKSHIYSFLGLTNLFFTHCPLYNQVFKFIRSVLGHLVPPELWGSLHNKLVFYDHLKRFIDLRRWETMNVQQMSEGFKVRSWLCTFSFVLISWGTGLDTGKYSIDWFLHCQEKNPLLKIPS